MAVTWKLYTFGTEIDFATVMTPVAGWILKFSASGPDRLYRTTRLSPLSESVAVTPATNAPEGIQNNNQN